tara:strand:+ start:447 stop:680 length:234 start_codon:yes stop_codon:yes gene_type:complete
METFFEFTDNYPWALPTGFAVVLLFGLFLRRRALAERATTAAEGNGLTVRDWNRARIQFLMTLGCVVLLFLIWALQT